jgi:N-methylhydantoinase A/oxoprolinase/acetone carboxylase beta subunit
MNAEIVEKYPVLTFASGPTNSMRGAAYEALSVPDTIRRAGYSLPDLWG